MAFKLSELLNPAPNSDPPSPTFHEKLPSLTQQPHISAPGNHNTPNHSRHNSLNDYPTVGVNRDVIDTYPKLSSSVGNPRRDNNGSELDYPPQRQTHSRGHSRTYSGSPVLTSYGPPATPVEPSPPLNTRPPFSPTLDQYHHPSRSPVTETKPLWTSRRTTSPPPILAPIQIHPLVSNELSAQKTSPTQEQDFRSNTADHKPVTSPVTAQQTINNDEMEDVRYEVKDQELATAQNTTITPHVQRASPDPLQPAQEEVMQSPMLQVKTEASATPREATPVPTMTQVSPHRGDLPVSPTIDALSPKAVPESNHGREGSIMNPTSTGASTPTHDTPMRGTPLRGTPTASKSTAKKLAAKSTAAKRGTASVVKKPQKKKRKLDSDSFEEPQSGRSSAAPVSSRASKTPAVNARKQSSTPVPAQASSSPAPEEYEEGVELYCICRRPDSHTWMIGCDGGCEDWFHGACVNIKQDDGDLIDKYICPNCEKDSKGVTTWKPMCRLHGCRRPARLSKKDLSKYCSDAHGREFMLYNAQRVRKRKRDDESSRESSRSPTRNPLVGSAGSALNKGQLSAVTKNVKDVTEFRKLGEGVLSPPPTISPEDGDRDGSGQAMVYNNDETKRLGEIATEKDKLAMRKQGLKDREKFIQLVKDRAKKVAAELGMKEICGFDSRLSWSEEEFLIWRDSEEGRSAFDSDVLAPPPAETDDPDHHSHQQSHMEEDLHNSHHPNPRIGVGACPKKRCDRHKFWRNIQMQDIRYEEVSIAERIGGLKQEEKTLRERARLRAIKEEEGDREGRVEIVDDRGG
ncbi:hypothetical protein FGG08_002733 [Glutinoglossum americanum]|uniref:PHD-type domain-containing protein n=1 Tax=Glutinoglossum americanum TaxID=1670608 RepID=A0A9P8L1B8_9PEZI|nr:hypothetical protein FGG08_002733 [Glutinoglossum americanum]